MEMLDSPLETTPIAPKRRSLHELVALEGKRSHRRRVLAWASLATLSLVGLALAFEFRPRPLPLDAQFRTEPVTQGDVIREVRATGHVEAVTTVQVGAEISGRIATVDAHRLWRGARAQGGTPQPVGRTPP
jgi:hypothetical protein